MDRRSFVVGSAAAAATLATGPSFGQAAYPSQPVMLINPFPPGGAADVVGRPFAAALEPLLKQPVKIETKAGAAGAVGAQFAATAKPDGYTLLLHIVSISGFAEADRINGRQPKFTLDEFIPIARLTSGPVALYTNDQTSYKSLKAVLEGGIEGRPGNVLFYATSNRRHLMPRQMIDNERSTTTCPSAQIRTIQAFLKYVARWAGHSRP